jgi:hypothetical protein
MNYHLSLFGQFVGVRGYAFEASAATANLIAKPSRQFMSHVE